MQPFFDDDLTPYIHGKKIYFCRKHILNLLVHKSTFYDQKTIIASQEAWNAN